MAQTKTNLFFLVIFSICVICQAYVPNVNYKIRDFCVVDAGVTVDIVQRLLNNPLENFTDEESCYVHCAFTESGFLSEDGEIIVDKFQELKDSVVPDVDLDCLKEIGKINQCNQMMELRRCHI